MGDEPGHSLLRQLHMILPLPVATPPLPSPSFIHPPIYFGCFPPLRLSGQTQRAGWFVLRLSSFLLILCVLGAMGATHPTLSIHPHTFFHPTLCT
eukprot:NODE_5272_length_519_cov_167.874468_g3904_i0.p3 GENE.NODE_5272_length_519_cov_167.874468_g3904_i0~~NODE_5272_length_519_cov_167.874468_g3904_i0.p3  ORF type:complete len:103 (-),score=11.74 NODE_5272_length_519_cov_167.874468_g3904_i0:211-495(-)